MNQKEPLKKLSAYSPRFQALLNKSRQSIKAGKGLSRDEFWQTVRERNEGREKSSQSLKIRLSNDSINLKRQE